MSKDNEIAEVMFRVDTTKDFKGTVYAMLPHECCDNKGNVTSYAHLGQHSGADYLSCLSRSKPAIISEYAELKAEMESIGYNLKIVKKRNYDKFLISYRKLN